MSSGSQHLPAPGSVPLGTIVQTPQSIPLNAGVSLCTVRLGRQARFSHQVTVPTECNA